MYRAPWRSILLFVGLAASLSVAAPLNAAEQKGLVHRVSKMEQCIFGVPHKELPMHDRVSQLEVQTIGKPQPGGIAKRLDTLERVVNGKTTALLPPIAPQLDTGATKPSVAPQIGSSPAPVFGSSPVSHSSAVSHSPAVSHPTESVDQMLRQGTLAHQTGRPDEAEKIFKEVLVKSPFNSNACFNLGAIAEGKGDLAGALGNYRTALIGAPNDPQIQEAIAQVESQISQKQDSPFKNPLVSTANGGTVLQGSASEYDPLAGQQRAPQTAQVAPFQPPLQARTSGWRTARNIGINVALQTARGAARGALRGNVNGIVSGAIVGGGRSTVANVFALGNNPTRARFGALAGNTLMNALHCPICRLLPF